MRVPPPAPSLLSSSPSIISLFRTAILLLIGLSLLCGGVYPLLILGIGKVAFSDQASGSLIIQNEKLIGSRLIGQEFSQPKYFWGRLSATSPTPYNAQASGGSNFSLNNPAFIEAVNKRIHTLQAADPQNTLLIPIDLVTASGSGLDPEISLAAAHYQLERVARVRKLNPLAVSAIIEDLQLQPILGFLGEPRVNVLMLNIALDKLYPVSP